MEGTFYYIVGRWTSAEISEHSINVLETKVKNIVVRSSSQAVGSAAGRRSSRRRTALHPVISVRQRAAACISVQAAELNLNPS